MEDDEAPVEDSDNDEDDQPLTISFSATSFAANRTTNILSTGYGAKATTRHQERELDNGERRHMMKVPMSRAGYLDHMRYIDLANKELMLCQFPHHLMRWKTAVGFWLLRVLLHNARVTSTR